MKHSPPKRALQFLRWFCRDDYLEEIEGDLVELFESRFSEAPRRALYLFIWGVACHFRPDFIRSFELILIHPAMLKHNLKITYRGFLRNKRTFLINIVGLSSALACALMVYLWASHELSVDKFHKNDVYLYQVKSNLKLSQDIITLKHTPVPLAKALKEEMPEVLESVAVNEFFSWRTEDGVLSNKAKQVQAAGYHAGPDFFKVFSFPLLVGDPDQVLNDKGKIVLSNKLAKDLYGNANAAIGQFLNWEHPLFQGNYEISGVFADVPENSTEQFDFLIGLDVLLDNDQYASSWGGGYASTYIVLKKGASIERFNVKIKDFLQQKDERLTNINLFAVPYSSQYLFSDFENGKQANGRIVYVRLFSLLAILILLIACINFTNLSTAKATLKMKEIGVKKTVGATRSNLIFQFLSESVLLVSIASIFALILVYLSLPQFNALSGKNLNLLLGWQDYILLIGFIALIGILAGSYPAFYLSRFRPLSVLKGKVDKAVGALWLRKGLVVFQFSISLLFLIGLMIVNRQIAFTQEKQLGYDRENIISFPWKGALYDHWTGLSEETNNQQFETFINNLEQIPGVKTVTNMHGGILENIYGQSGVDWEGKEEDMAVTFKSPIIGYDFIETMGINLKSGRTFSKEKQDDYTKVILNETAVKLMELEDPLNAKIQVNSEQDRVIGVVSDFHYGSLHNEIEPLIFRFDPNGRTVLIKLQEGAMSSALSAVKDLYQEFLPNFEFDYSFMDEDYAQLYESEQRVAILSRYLAAIAIIISCLGLLGLVAFSAERRAKEISIRRVLGSSMAGIIRLFSKEYIKILLLSIIIALPLSYYIAQSWLQSFSDQISLHWTYFVWSALILVGIAGLTISLQTLKVARSNPTQFLSSD